MQNFSKFLHVSAISVATKDDEMTGDSRVVLSPPVTLPPWLSNIARHLPTFSPPPPRPAARHSCNLPPSAPPALLHESSLHHRFSYSCNKSCRVELVWRLCLWTRFTELACSQTQKPGSVSVWQILCSQQVLQWILYLWTNFLISNQTLLSLPPD